MPKRTGAALVTGATRGIGYLIGKEIVKRLPRHTTFMTSRGSVEGYSSILGMELGAEARERTKFVSLDIREMEQVANLKDKIVKSFGGLDILVNNAGIYRYPEKDRSAFHKQAREILNTNYWGTKNVIGAFMPHFKPHSRIVNITSNVGHMMAVQGVEKEIRNMCRERFNDCKNECELDGLMMKFERDALYGTWVQEGWPSCAYAVSKMGINAYTRILQQQFDFDEREDVVVNAVYPMTKHSKIDQSGLKLLDDEEGGRFVFYMATVMPNSHGVFPRGAVIWNNSKIVEDQNKYTFKFNNKHRGQLY